MQIDNEELTEPEYLNPAMKNYVCENQISIFDLIEVDPNVSESVIE